MAAVTLQCTTRRSIENKPQLFSVCGTAEELLTQVSCCYITPKPLYACFNPENTLLVISDSDMLTRTTVSCHNSTFESRRRFVSATGLTNNSTARNSVLTLFAQRINLSPEGLPVGLRTRRLFHHCVPLPLDPTQTSNHPTSSL